MRAAGEEFADFAWGFVGGAPISGYAKSVARSVESEALSAALKSRGFKFVAR